MNKEKKELLQTQELVFDTDDYTDSYDDVDLYIQDFAYVVKQLKGEPDLKVTAYGFNWRGDTGYLIVHDFRDLSDEDLFCKIIPSYECTVKVYKESDKLLTAVVYSHDVPTGSTWTFETIKDEDDKEEY